MVRTVYTHTSYISSNTHSTDGIDLMGNKSHGFQLMQQLLEISESERFIEPMVLET